MLTVLWIVAALSTLGYGAIVISGILHLASRAGAGRRAFAPPVSILKPLKGAEPGLAENLESFFRLDYPEYEIIFSFASLDDPAFPIARIVADRHPEISTTFVLDSREAGMNPKVSRLIPGLSRARFAHLLISDGDVRVDRRYLRDSMAEFSDPRVGLVSNLFRGIGGENFGARLENLHFNSFVLGGTAAVSRLLGQPCVVGKSIFLSRAALEWIGGFDAVKDFLAEDYLLGDLLSRAGFRVVLSTHLITACTFRKGFRAFWDRQVRWSRMRRRLAPGGYLAEAFASPVPWLLALMAGSHGPARAAAAVLIAAKLLAETMALKALGLRPRISDFLLAPIKDLAVFGVFWAGLLSSRTNWRGRPVRIGIRTLLRAEA